MSKLIFCTLFCKMCALRNGNRYPTRTARFGVALVESGTLRLKQAAFVDDNRPIDETCDCIACRVCLLKHEYSTYMLASAFGF